MLDWAFIKCLNFQNKGAERKHRNDTKQISKLTEEEKVNFFTVLSSMNVNSLDFLCWLVRRVGVEG